jgi:hypothetical protein
MKEQKERSENGKDGSGKLPPAGEPVWVRCEGYRTMAYLDSNGVWRSAATDKELNEVVGVEQEEKRAEDF